MIKRVLMIFTCFFLLMNYFPFSYVSAVIDNQIPIVESLEVTPKEANVGDIITIKVKITDTSGVKGSKVEFRTPSGFSRYVGLYFNSISGLWEGTYQVQPTDEPGTWTSNYMYLSDNAGNYGSMNPSLHITIINKGEIDNQIPKVENLELNPKEANVGDIITIKAKITDTSGVMAAHVEFCTPTGFSRYIGLYFNSISGLWEGTYQVQSTDEPGTWTSNYMYLSDNAGNYGSMNPSLHITIINKGEIDNQIPKVENLELNPKEANIGDIITIKAKITDTSGVMAAHVELRTPTGFNRYVGLYFNSISGLWEGNYQVKAADEPGTWTSNYMYLSDNAGNYGSINPSLNITILSDNLPPATPTVKPITDQDTVITGTTEANAIVIVNVGTIIIGSGTADSTGKFSISIPLQKSGTKILVTAKDIVGNESKTEVVSSTSSPSVKVQLNGKDFSPAYFVNGTTYVQWGTLKVFNIPYTYKGNGIFEIDGRTVKGRAINGSIYIRWSELAPGEVTFKKISGGYNFIYTVPVKIQLNGQGDGKGYFKDGTTYLHWSTLKLFNIPYAYIGNGVFEIQGRTVLGVSIGGNIYIRWSLLAPGKITYDRIVGGMNFIYKT